MKRFFSELLKRQYFKMLDANVSDPMKVDKNVKLNRKEFKYLFERNLDVVAVGKIAKNYYLKVKDSQSIKYWMKLWTILKECDESLGRKLDILEHNDSLYYKVKYVYTCLKQRRERLELKKKKKKKQLGEIK